MLKFLKAFFDLEWIPAVGKWILKFASYSIEIPMVISAIYIMLVSGIPGWKDALWYDRSIGLLLASPEILLPGAIIRATSMFQRGEVKKAKVTIWIISAMAGLTALTLALIMIFHLDESSPLMACVLFLRILASLAYSIITRIEMDHEVQPHRDPPALFDSWAMVGLAGYLQQDFQQQLNQAIAKLPVPPALTAIQQMIDSSLAEQSGAQKQALDLLKIDQQRMFLTIQEIENSVPEVDLESIARAIVPTFQSQVRAIVEEAQSHFPEPEPRRQIEARATAKKPEPPAKSQKPEPANVTRFPVKRPEPGPQKEPEARANGNPEERLQSAYEVLVAQSGRVSGRALAKLAHVNRETASKWLGEIQGQSDSDSEPVVESTIEPLAQGQ